MKDMIGGDAKWKAIVKESVERVRNAVHCPICGEWYDGRRHDSVRLRQALEAILALEGHAYLLPIGHPDAEERQMLAQSVVHNIARTALTESGCISES